MAKLEDIISQIQSELPKYDDNFYDEVNVTNVSRSGTEITLTVDDDLVEDTHANIKGVYCKLLVSAVEAGDESNQWVLTTEQDHDQTYSDVEKQYGVTKTCTFVGDFSGDKTLIEVPENNQITIESDTEPTGTFYLLEDRQYSGRKEVTIYNDNHTVKYDVAHEIDAYSDSGVVINNIRVDGLSSADDIIRYLENNAVQLTKYHIFVVMGNVLSSADRHVFSDARNKKQTSQDLQTECVEDFSLYVIIPTQSDTGPRSAINYIYTLRPYICNCLHGAVFDSGFSEGSKYCAVFAGDSGETYNQSYYVHRFDFENVFNITNADSVPVEYTRAFQSFEIGIKMEFDDYEEVKKQVNGTLNETEDFS